ncbi:MAG TPA: pantoate--beta-alanine ligase [Bacteroidales bacterium]|nr:pantoate--beta-alanine ligase [Bacteroidales bacterium]HOK98294.1 pantoate--beta-alanine ligase [Bacteroidales bacterium]HPO65150.1 pantoate--beta-alanine ligase [Bacteroidales bacterium]
MEIFNTKKSLRNFLDSKSENVKVGFVPTMGALHEGHLSLVRCCRNQNEVVVVSIFVNPTQFNDKEDLANYPRTLDKDLELLRQEHVDVVFCPSVEEMYPEPDTRTFDLGGLDTTMEGAFRPGHFNGVVQIVTKLFEVVLPHRAYFGEKDFQQLTIIRYIVNQLNIPVQIVPCPIVREPDGLAMSSRNMLLGANERQAAPLISQVLFKAKDLKNSLSVSELKKWVVDQIDANPYLQTEYFEIVDDVKLQPVNSWEDPVAKVGCIAVRAGKIRLIDNIRF